MRKLVGRVLIGMSAALMAAALWVPAAAASPIGDAEAAMMAAWEKAGGDTSPLGARKGDVYPVGDGFCLDFDGGKMFFTTDTGAKFVYGPILDKYESLGGPAGSDLGFPTINEVPGLAGPDSRVTTFAASDKPVIFWTSDRGAFVVRGAMNAAWDKLGSSGGVLGAPVGDETYGGEVTSQKFSGGEISWNRQTKEFTTNPAPLADQLKGLQVAIDPTAAINMAWRAAGGANGALGAKQGGQYPVGGDGIVQNFAGGKVFFSPATGANALESDVLAKYESLGGPAGSDLGFPVANESDGGLAPSSRIATFSAADKPVIFWTANHGAFVVRGAIKAAWDKLRGPGGKLGAPVGDQAVIGDVISQQFTGGKVSWNRTKNSFTTDPSNLAPLLSGLQVSGQNQPSTAAMPAHAKKFAWHWWWLLAVIPLLVLVALSAWMTVAWRRRRARRGTAAAYEPQRDADIGYEPPADGRWVRDDADVATEHLSFDDLQPAEHQPPDAGTAARVSWSRGARPIAGPVEDVEENPDAVDTDSIPVVWEAALSEADYDEDGYPDLVVPRTPPGVGYPAAGGPDAAEPDAAYPDVVVPYAVPDVVHPDAAALDAQVSDVVGEAAAPGGEPRIGRHAVVDDEGIDDLENLAAVDDIQDIEGIEDVPEVAPDAANPAPAAAGRPTIHLPLNDPYLAPEGYPIKASARSGLYYTPDSELYYDTLAEIWLSSEEVAQANGFVKAD